MKHKFLKASLFLLFLLLAKDVEALDITKTGKLDITYQYDQEVFENKSIYLYKVADINETGMLTYQTLYQGNEDPNNLTTSQWSTLASTLSTFQEKNKIPYDKVEITNQEGKASFENLPLGLYLVKVESTKDENYEYNTSPMLLTIPNFDELKNDYLYDIVMVTKTEGKKIPSEIEKPTDDEKNKNQNTSNKTDVPYTFDAIFIYIIIATISLLGMIIIIYLITKNRKDKENDDTKKDE